MNYIKGAAIDANSDGMGGANNQTSTSHIPGAVNHVGPESVSGPVV